MADPDVGYAAWAVLSESLVGHVLLDLLAAETVTFGGSEADLRLMRRGQADQLVEVKASGASSFVELKPRDLVRDLLVWADFGRRYETGAGAITLHILGRPRQITHPAPSLGDQHLDGGRMVRLTASPVRKPVQLVG